MTKPFTTDGLLCPSAHVAEPGAQLFGVQTGDRPETRRVGYLDHAVPVTEEVLAIAGDAIPGAVLRVAAPCMKSACLHHGGSGCSLGARIASMLEPVVSGLPACAIRPRCVWFRQEGRAACLRCPQVATAEGEEGPLDAAVSGVMIPADDPFLRADRGGM